MGPRSSGEYRRDRFGGRKAHPCENPDLKRDELAWALPRRGTGIDLRSIDSARFILVQFGPQASEVRCPVFQLVRAQVRDTSVQGLIIGSQVDHEGPTRGCCDWTSSNDEALAPRSGELDGVAIDHLVTGNGSFVRPALREDGNSRR